MPAGLLAATLLALLAGRVHTRRIERSWDTEARTALGDRLARVESRQRHLTRELQRLADRAAVLPGTSAALRGERGALLRLFHSLETLAPGEEGGRASAVRTPTGSILAWTGRTSEIRGLPSTVTTRGSAFVLAGSVTTTLVTTSPVRGPDGALIGFASAELPLRVQRNIQNDYLHDFDRLADAAEGVEVRYRDVRTEGPVSFPPPPPGVLARDAQLRAPDGSPLATVRVSAPAKEAVLSRLEDRYRRVACGLLMLAVLAWAMGTSAPAGPSRRCSFACSPSCWGGRCLRTPASSPLPSSARPSTRHSRKARSTSWRRPSSSSSSPSSSSSERSPSPPAPRVRREPWPLSFFPSC